MERDGPDDGVVERGGVKFEVGFGPGVRAVGVQDCGLVGVGDGAFARGGVVDVEGPWLGHDGVGQVDLGVGRILWDEIGALLGLKARAVSR